MEMELQEVRDTEGKGIGIIAILAISRASYPVVIAAGDMELTAEEGRRLAQYVDEGGTLLLAGGT